MKRTCIISLIALLFSFQSIAQNKQLIHVEGIARIQEVPKEIIVSINLSIKDSLYQVCFNKSVESLEKLKTHFKSNGIKSRNIRVNNLIVNENYEFVKSKRLRKGYKSSILLEIKDRYNDAYSNVLLNSLNQEDLNISYRINFRFTEEQKTKLRKQALELAIKDATEKAELIASSSGLQLKQIKKITYGSNSTYFDSFDIIMDEECCDTPPRKGNGSGITFNPKEQSIQKSILMEWSFE
ncbi:SIMPL domain-containing protein [Carboxylicivirga sp. N1Y90]|uniref:SIMPL domain-containing protein n=1 Tax=Carboxylicivirga fragile TaxID=3417571 RepID=UPI003D3417FD|nr:SIMPL domain-containing protein [Marinilabiliaceae bacterium N1Y90]